MKTFSVCTLGCRVNQYESRALTELFVANGYTAVPFGEKCNVCIVNTCAVTGESERKSAQMIRRAQKLCDDVRVCGCFAQNRGKFEGVKRLTGCFNKGSLQDFVTVPNTEKGYELLSIGNISAKAMPTVAAGRAYVKIEDGCNGRCTYCIIPTLRGKIRSRPPEDIMAEVKRLAADGCEEIILTGIETAAYNYMPLWELIKEVSTVEGIERIRLGSLDPLVLNPAFIKTAAETKKLMPHFHISLQSGCSRVLKLMGRPYTAEEAKEKIKALQMAIPGVMLSADIICSFPTETAEELEETITYLEDIGFLHIHAFSYSKRPGTPAAEMAGQVPEDEKRRRIKGFIERCKAMSADTLSSFIGKSVKVLVEKVVGDTAHGHTEHFCEATVKTNRPLREGDIVECTVYTVEDSTLICSI